MPIFSKKNSCLGIDIGTNSIKIVEVESTEEGYKLSNYGAASVREVMGVNLRGKSEVLTSAVNPIADTIQAILKEAGIKGKKSYFSVPNFSSFFTSFEIPKTKKEEIESAIQFQARQRIPLPLNEVTLDPTLMEVDRAGGDKAYKVILLAVPDETIKAYRRIAKEVGLKMGALDSEVLGLADIFGKEGENTLIADIGNQDTTINVLIDKNPVHSNNLPYSTGDFFEKNENLPTLAYNNPDDEEEKAEKIKRKRKDPLAEDFTESVIDILESFEREKGEKVDTILLTGGGAKVEEIEEKMKDKFEDVEKARPLEKLEYPEKLERAVEKLNPFFSVATGMALKGLKK